LSLTVKTLCFLACLLASSALVFAQTPEEKHAKELKKDVELGADYVKELEKELKLSKDEAKIERVRRIGAELASAANKAAVPATWGDGRLNTFEYTFKVIDDPDVNAFSVPGGYIYVHSGLLDDVESDDELAGVLAHEVAHAAHRHVITLMKEKSKIDLLTIPALIAAMLSGSPEVGALATGSQLASIALTSGWSERAELDADRTAFYYLEKTKYNPVGLLTFMERLAFREQKNSPHVEWGIYRTHPPSGKRVSGVMDLLRGASLPIARSKVTTSFRVTSEEKDGHIKVRFGKELLFELKGFDAAARAGEAVEMLNSFFDSSPQLYAVKASNSKIVWYGKTLVQFVTDDGDVDTLVQSAYNNIKRSVFSLGYRTGG
jgi:predicted Zn-dependent protease